MISVLVKLKPHILHTILRNTIGVDLRKNVSSFSCNEIAFIVASDEQNALQYFIVTSSGCIGWVYALTLERIE